MEFSSQEYWSGSVISYSRGSSQPRDWNCVFCISCIDKQTLCHYVTWKVEENVFFPISRRECVCVCVCVCVRVCVFSLPPGGHLPTLQNGYPALYWLILYLSRKARSSKTMDTKFYINITWTATRAVVRICDAPPPEVGAIVIHTVKFISVNIGHTTLDSKDTIKSIEKQRDEVLRDILMLHLKL